MKWSCDVYDKSLHLINTGLTWECKSSMMAIYREHLHKEGLTVCRDKEHVCDLVIADASSVYYSLNCVMIKTGKDSSIPTGFTKPCGQRTQYILLYLPFSIF